MAQDLRNLHLSDLERGLDDLFSNRLAALRQCVVGRMYEEMLRTRKAALDALPSAKGTEPLNEDLGLVDTTHDRLGTAIFYMTEAYLRHPRVSAEQRAGAQHIRDAFIPVLDELNHSFADEADRAKHRREHLKSLSGTLSLFPVSGEQTLADWVEDFLDQGEKLEKLLHQRATSDSAPKRDLGSLRMATLSLLSRMRAAIADELNGNPELPRNMDELVFGGFDDLAKRRGVEGGRGGV